MSFGFINYHKKQGEVTEMTDGNNVFMRMLETIEANEANANNNTLIHEFDSQKEGLWYWWKMRHIETSDAKEVSRKQNS